MSGENNSSSSNNSTPQAEGAATPVATPNPAATDQSQKDGGQNGAGQTDATPPVSAKKKYQLKVRGKVEELELDDNEHQALLQKGRNADQWLGKAKEAEKALRERQAEIDQMREYVKSNPKEAVKKFGWSKDQLLEMLAEEEILANMTPEEKEAYDNKLFREQVEQERAQKAEQEAQAQRDQQFNVVVARKQKELLDFVASTNLFDKFATDGTANEHQLTVLKNVARIMAEAAAEKIQMTPEIAYGEYIEEFKENFNSLIPNLSDQALAEILGQERLDRLSKARIEMLNQATSKGNGQLSERPVTPPKATPSGIIRPNDFLRGRK